MRVAFVNVPYGAGLQDPHDLLRRYPVLPALARAVAAAGATEVSVVQRFARDAHFRDEGVAYHFVADGRPEAPADRLWAPRLAARVAALAPDVVHLHGLLPLPARQLRGRLPRRTILLAQDHGGAGGFAKRGWRLFNRLGLRAADGFLFSARQLADPWIAAGVIGRDQPIHELMESGTTLPESAPQVRRLPGAPALLWVGRLNDNKDPLTILDGFQRALPRLPGAALTMLFGESDLLPRVERAVAASALLARHVHLAGRLAHDELPAVYAGADLFVLGSHHESLCFSLVEALSFGLTPVVTDIPPFRTLTGGARIGALFPPGDAAACADALLRAAAGADRAAVRAHFQATLSWPVLGRRALAVYQRASRSPSRRSP